jgi:hypothetical protein
LTEYRRKTTERGDNMKKVALFATAALMGLALMFALTGCGANNEKVIRDGLTDELNELKDPNSTTVTEAAQGLSTDVITAWLDGFDFEIGTIAIEGDTAEATVTITCKQIYPAVMAAQERILGGEEDLTGLSSDEIESRMNELIVEELQSASPVSTELVIPCNKSDNTWSVDVTSTSELTNALAGSE